MGVVHHGALGIGGFHGRILSSRPLRYIGQISYGIYVYHITVFGALTIAWPWIYHNTWWLLPVKVAATFAVAIPSYHLFEKPINDLKDKAVWKRSVTKEAATDYTTS